MVAALSGGGSSRRVVEPIAAGTLDPEDLPRQAVSLARSPSAMKPPDGAAD